MNRFIGKDPNGGKDGKREEKGMTEDEVVGGITDVMDMSLSKRGELLQSMGSQRVRLATEQLN